MKKCILILIASSTLLSFTQAQQQWTIKKASEWFKKKEWLVGANYIPAYAINQLEFWQEESFDLTVIDKELGWAQSIGMNCMRVYLHHAAWLHDQEGFKQRIEEFLKTADDHNIEIVFVFFDECWNDVYRGGKQAAPKPGIHNSGWLKDPGNRWQQPVADSRKSSVVKKDSVRFNLPLLDTLERYVKDVLTTFKNDKRVLMWDLYNEPGQFDQHEKSLPLLKLVFRWAREVNPTQPLSSGVYDDNEKAITNFQLTNSDVITYHSYDKPEIHQRRIDSLSNVTKGRPMICTEYMARKRGSTFAAILPMLKKQNIGAINWGLVDGKTQTKYAWDEKEWGNNEPALWFHDIFRKDGSAYDEKEVELIKRLTGKKAGSR
jgi:endo-1,4-beta-mannosidase